MAFPEPVSYLTKQQGYNQDVSPVVPAPLAVSFDTLTTNGYISAGYSAVVVRKYKINAGAALSMGLGSRLRIL